MAIIDVAGKSLTVKIVYYGCAMGGKTTNLVTLHRLTDPQNLQGLVSIATNDDRTLFFDLLPIELGQVGGLNVKVKLYTVPGQVHYEQTRRQVLGGADGVVLVVDSAPEAAKNNVWATDNLRYNIRANRLPDGTPVVLQWNKRDLHNARRVEDLQSELNPRGLPAFEAVATTGVGVLETFGAVLRLAVSVTYERTGRKPPPLDQIGQTIDRALAQIKQGEGNAQRDDRPVFEHSFDMDRYREAEAEQGHDRRVVHESALLSEAVNTNMLLAEKLDSLKALERVGDRRASMMKALADLAPLLSDPSKDALPVGAMALLVHGARRQHGSLLLSRPGQDVLDEREVVPRGPDPLNASVAAGLGSVAHRLTQRSGPYVIDDLGSEIFFGQPPPGAEALASVLVAPLGCDGLAFGALFVYSRIVELAFDDTEKEYWSTAAHLVGLSLHWHALRRKLMQTKVS